MYTMYLLLKPPFKIQNAIVHLNSLVQGADQGQMQETLEIAAQEHHQIKVPLD